MHLCVHTYSCMWIASPLEHYRIINLVCRGGHAHTHTHTHAHTHTHTYPHFRSGPATPPLPIPTPPYRPTHWISAAVGREWFWDPT